MSRFVFRFGTLLKIRRQHEDRHKRIVAGRLREIADVREREGALEGQIELEMDAMRQAQSPGVLDLQQTVRRRHWLGHLHRTLLDAHARRGFLEAKLAQERAALAEAAKQRRILEKLEERQHERYLDAERRQETRELDEMAVVRHRFQQPDPAGDGEALSNA